MTKRSIFVGVSGFGLAWLLFYLFWGVLLGRESVWPEYLSDWVVFLSALIIPAVFAANKEDEFGYNFVDSLKFIGLFLVACVGANMIGFSLGSVIVFIEAIIYEDYETIGTFVGLFLTLAFIGAPGSSITIWVFEVD